MLQCCVPLSVCRLICFDDGFLSTEIRQYENFPSIHYKLSRNDRELSKFLAS